MLRTVHCRSSTLFNVLRQLHRGLTRKEVWDRGRGAACGPTPLALSKTLCIFDIELTKVVSSVILSLEPPYAIPLSSATGALIPNCPFSGPLSAQDQFSFERLEEKYGATTRIRTRASARYNCHGLTFAARRTGISEDEPGCEDVLGRILREDCYSKVSEDEALPGDVIVYFSNSGVIQHTGIILTSPKDEISSFPSVCSKWGRFHELIHAANNCPYNWRNIAYFRIIKC